MSYRNACAPPTKANSQGGLGVAGSRLAAIGLWLRVHESELQRAPIEVSDQVNGQRYLTAHWTFDRRAKAAAKKAVLRSVTPGGRADHDVTFGHLAVDIHQHTPRGQGPRLCRLPPTRGSAPSSAMALAIAAFTLQRPSLIAGGWIFIRTSAQNLCP